MAYLRCAPLSGDWHGDHAVVISDVQRVEAAPRERLVYRRGWRLDPVGRA